MTLKFTKTKLSLVVLVLIAVTATAGVWLWNRRTTKESYLTAKIERGNIKNAVYATGALQAVTTVQVGSQVSGNISALYADFNSQVKKGQIVAQLDPAIFQAQVNQARANLDQARADYANAQAQLVAAQSSIDNQRAGVSGANANLAALKAQRDDAASFLERQRTLATGGLIPERDLESAQTAFRAADARYQQAAAQLNQAQLSEKTSASSGIAQAQAQIQQAQARIKQNEAALQLAEVNLSHATVRSPIDGVVVSRNVDVGQTVAASLSAPTLFTIANDLTQMQVIANIDQADIGQINQSNRATFSVDAFPGQNFEGTIHQIRLNSQNVQNVVTYNVVIDVHNPELKLRPGMTANLTMTVSERTNIIKVPNAALRFRPQGMTQEQIREAIRGAGGAKEGEAPKTDAPKVETAKPGEASKPQAKTGAPESSPAERGARRSGDGNRIASNTDAVLEGQSRIVWVLGPDQKPQPRRIKVGITDGTATEVLEGNLNEGELIIVGQNVTADNKPQTQLPGGFGGAPGGRGGTGGGGRRN